MPRNISTLVSTLLKRVNIDLTDPKYIDLVNITGQIGEEAYTDVEGALNRLMTLEEARYQRQVVGSEQYPTANANGSYTNEQASKKGLFAAFGKSAAPAFARNALGPGYPHGDELDPVRYLYLRAAGRL